MPEEIGLLLSAITLHGTKGVHHNIGLAKGYGYGKLDIAIDQISGFAHDKDYYLKFFEYYINNFTHFAERTACRWSNSDQIKKLMAIMSDHAEGLEMMTLKSHKPASEKQNKEKVKLTEKDYPAHTFIEDNPPEFDLVGLKLHNAIKKHIQ